jgi:hypothetical protein
VLEQAGEGLPAYLADLVRRGYGQDLVRVCVGKRDNWPPDLRFSTIAREWNRRWAYPRLVASVGYLLKASPASARGAERLKGGSPGNCEGKCPPTADVARRETDGDHRSAWLAAR